MAINWYYLSVGLGLFFLAVGCTKVVPIQPAYGTQVSHFNRFVSVFPFYSFTGYRPSADLYRAVTGVVEIVFGALLAFGNRHWHRYSAFVLLVVMCGAIYTLFAAGDPPEYIIVPAFCGSLLIILIRERHY